LLDKLTTKSTFYFSYSYSLHIIKDLMNKKIFAKKSLKMIAMSTQKILSHYFLSTYIAKIF